MIFFFGCVCNLEVVSKFINFMWFKCQKNKERVHNMRIIAFDGLLSVK